MLPNHQLPHKEQLIYALIPPGHSQAVNSAKLAQLAGLSERDTRETVYSLVVKHGLPIGSCTEPTSGGYFIIQNEEDLRIATKHLVPRLRALIRRTKALERIAREKFSHQLKLSLDE